MTAPQPIVVVLTGGIGSGKSTVAKIFETKGAYVIDADQLSREVVRIGQPALSAIEQRFGPSILLANGELNRTKLAEIIFTNHDQRTWLEHLLHPLIHAAFHKHLSTIQSTIKDSPQALILYVAPLYFEALHPSKDFSAIIVISTSKENCVSRVMARDSISRTQATQRIESQMPLEQKCALADYVINNDTNIQDLEEQAELIFSKLIKL